MQIYCYLLRSQLIQLASSPELKEYEADWREGGGKVMRQGGKFASKSTSVKYGFDSDYVDSLAPNVTQLNIALNKLSYREQEEIKSGVFSKNAKKARQDISKIFDKTDKSAGDAFRDVNSKLEKDLQEKKGFAGFIESAKKIVGDTIDKAEKNKELIGFGAGGALLAVAGGAAAIAFLSLPAIVGTGGIFAGFSSLMAGGAALPVFSSFAVGGLSALGATAAAVVTLEGMLRVAGTAFLAANKEARDTFNAVSAQAKQASKERAEIEAQIMDDLVAQGYSTEDGLATPKFIELMKKSGYLPPDFVAKEPYKLVLQDKN